MPRLAHCLALLLAASCAGELKPRPVSLDASNPDASESPPRPASTTLAPEPPAAEEPETPTPHEHPHHGEPAKGSAIYACPMHSETTSPAPGECPQCGMKLVERKPAVEPPRKPQRGHEGHR